MHFTALSGEPHNAPSIIVMLTQSYAVHLIRYARAQFSAANQTSFIANANQSNESVTVVKISTVVKFNFQGCNKQFPRLVCPPNKFYRECQPIK